MFEEIDTGRLIRLSLRWRCSSRGASSFHAERGSSSAHNVCWFDGCVLDSVWFDYLFRGGALFACAVEHSPGEPADYEHDRISKLRAEWQPQGSAETLMTCINGAWPFPELLSSPEVILSRPLSCLSLLTGDVWAGRSRFDLHTRPGSVPAFTRPLKDDKI